MRARRLPLRRVAKKSLQSTRQAVLPLSPTSKKIKKAQESLAQDAAFNKLLAIRSANGGKKVRGDSKKL
jgi:hypothetical protein